MCYGVGVERLINLTIEKLPEGVYVGTSDDVQGLVVQGDTIAQVIEYAREMVPIIEAARAEFGFGKPLGGVTPPERFEMPLVLAA